MDYVIVGGDLNTDLSRIQSLHTASLQNFCKNEQLHNFIRADFSYKSDMSLCKSAIYHFLVSENLLSQGSDYYCTHDADNLSDLLIML